MFTSDIKKSVFFYTISTIFLIILNYVYSLFSHNVSSNYMIYMFVYPLICGIIINLIYITHKNIVKIKAFYIGKNIINYGISVLVVRNFLRGVFEIAGTNSSYIIYYNYIGIALVIIGVTFLIYGFYYEKRLTKIW